jgi:methylglutaconyl-CoA hydratase
MKLHNLDIDNRGVATVTLNRPEILNAFDDELIKELITTFLFLQKSENVRVVVLTGAGKSFCAGADVNWMKRMKDYSFDENLNDAKVLADLFSAVNSCRYPVIGKINGHALGGGAGLVACCDYVIAADSALMGFTEVKLGLLPAVISPFVIAKIGESHARATFLSGERFNMTKAFAMGLVHQVSTIEELDKNTNVVVEGFLTAAPNASILAKDLIKNIVKFNSILEARDYTCETIANVRKSSEGQEGMSALLEKRKAKWL